MASILKPSVNWLLAFLPVTLFLEHGHASPPLVFFSAAIGIVPIASLIVHSTEQIAKRTGDAIGGLLNSTFGNAPELIIMIVALKAGYLRMVLASLAGVILANLLLAVGVGFLLGGFRYKEQRYNAEASHMYATMMLIAVISLMSPGIFSSVFAPDSTIIQEHYVNIGLAIVLLLLYGLYLVFMLRTHPDVFASEGGGEVEHHEKPWSMPRAVGTLLGASVLAAWMSEILVGAAEGTGEALGMSQAFMGIVFLALVGGAAESGSAVAMARKNKVDLTMGIALGSSIQIALFVAPVLVLASYFIAPVPLQLDFGGPLSGILFLGVLIAVVVASGGRSNWFKGAQLIAVYAIFALLFYFVPTR